MIAALASHFVTVGVAGFGLAALLISGSIGCAEFVAFAWLLGCVGVSILVFVLSLFIPHPWNVAGVVSLVAAFGAFGWFRMRRGLLN